MIYCSSITAVIVNKSIYSSLLHISLLEVAVVKVVSLDDAVAVREHLLWDVLRGDLVLLLRWAGRGR